MSDILQDNVLEFGATEDGDVDIVKSTTTAGHHDVTVTHCTQHSETVTMVTSHTTITLSTVRVHQCHCNPSLSFKILNAENCFLKCHWKFDIMIFTNKPALRISF